MNPFCSIIIPVLNNPTGLRMCIDGLVRQDYGSRSFEVIVVDNGSTDCPKEIVSRHGYTFIKQVECLNSPYSSRNRAIEIAKGDIIVFLDTTCSPAPSWLSAGVAAIEDGADLVGGNVVFDVDRNSTFGEMYDSLSNIRMKESVVKRQVAKTTNLFVKRTVVSKVGLFPEGLRSGGDVRWTHNAVSKGFRLEFSKNAKVFMTPRGMRPLISKQWRVAKGLPKIWMEHHVFGRQFFLKVILGWLPPNPLTIYGWMISSDNRWMAVYLPQLWLLGWVLRLLSGLGALKSIVIGVGR